MKRTIIIMMVSLMTIPTLFAQGDFRPDFKPERKGDNRCEKGDRMEKFKEKIRVEKVAFISSELELTYDEAQNFWPIYNQYDKDLMAIRDKNRPKDTTLNNGFPMRPDFLKMREEEAQTILKNHFQTERDVISLQEKYSKELLKAISTQKITKLFFVEKEFMANVIGKGWKDMKRDGDKKIEHKKGKKAQNERQEEHPQFK